MDPEGVSRLLEITLGGDSSAKDIKEENLSLNGKYQITVKFQCEVAEGKSGVRAKKEDVKWRGSLEATATFNIENQSKDKKANRMAGD
jgi:hypothetical protein